jgi:diguanylate cyclase (GGDEF)-like protein
VIGDLDHFKAINDDLGHPAGDEVLRRVAKAIETAVRRVDVPFRIGGEEFAVIVPATDLASAHLLAERVREVVAQTFTSDPRAVTISLGVAAYPEHGPDGTSLIAHADAACYQAKARGRNRSVSAAKAIGTPMSIPTPRTTHAARGAGQG